MFNISMKWAIRFAGFLSLIVIIGVLSHAQPNSPVSAGLIGYWSFDEDQGQVAQDSSAFRHNGTLQNSPNWTNGHNNAALSFDGFDDHVLIPFNQRLDGLTSITISIWAFLDSNPDTTSGNDWRLLFGNASEGSRPFGLILEQNGKLSASVYVAEERQVIRTSVDDAFPLRDWVYITFSYNGTTGQMQLYLNDTLVVERNGNPGNIDSAPEEPFSISMKKPASIEDVHAWPGLLDEVRLYNRVLSQSEILQLYTNDLNRS